MHGAYAQMTITEDTDYVQAVEFLTFPRPVIEDPFHPQTVASNEWIKQ